MALPAASDHWLELLDEPAALLAPPNSLLIAANRRFAEALGCEPGTLDGTSLSRLGKLLDASGTPACLETQHAAAQLTLRLLQAGSEVQDRACHVGPPRDGQRLLRLATDAETGLRRQIVELQQKLTWFREAIDKVGHSVVVFDREGRLVLCNKFYRDGYRSGDRVLPRDIPLEGKTYRELMELRVRYKLHKEFADEPEKFIEDRVRRFEAGTDHITYLATGTVVRSQYRRLEDGVRVYISTNITELAETAERQRAIELAYRTKSQFLANMSHELRTPLHAVLGFSQLIRDAAAGPLDARYRSYADDINVAGQHLLNLINDILDVSKIEVGRMELREGTVDLADVVQKCCRLIHERAREDGQQIEIDLPGSLPCLRGDELRLRQVVLNLLSNAVKFTPTGGRIRISAEHRPDGTLALSIADNGIGMGTEDIGKALTPFQQLRVVPGRHHDGTGLGLPLAKTLTELHGAAFQIDSAPGAGTTVTIVMPTERVLDGLRRHRNERP